jgi:hypothetical protein
MLHQAISEPVEIHEINVNLRKEKKGKMMTINCG